MTEEQKSTDHDTWEGVMPSQQFLDDNLPLLPTMWQAGLDPVRAKALELASTLKGYMEHDVVIAAAVYEKYLRTGEVA